MGTTCRKRSIKCSSFFVDFWLRADTAQYTARTIQKQPTTWSALPEFKVATRHATAKRNWMARINIKNKAVFTGNLLGTICYDSTMRFLPFFLCAASRLSAAIHL